MRIAGGPRAQLRVYYWIMAPVIAVMAAFFVLPLIQVLWLSVSDPVLGLQNYVALIENALIHKIWWNTLRICLLTTVVSIVLGYALAYALAHVGERQRTVMFFCILLTFWLSVLIRSFAWVMLLRTEGVINTAMMSIGIIDQPLRLVRNELGVIIGMTHYMLPVATMTMYANMRTIPRSHVDAARGLGASPVQAFLLVYLSQSKPGIVAAAILVFIFSLGFYITPAILGGGGIVMITEYIRVSFEDTLRWGYATMLATTLLFGLVVVLALFARAVDLKKVFGA